MRELFEISYAESETVSSEWPESLRLAISEHRAGDYIASLKHYDRVSFESLPENVREIAMADRILVRTKLGEVQDLRNPLPFRNKIATILFHYARYTWAFWVDHKIAWSSLRQLLVHSWNSPLEGHFEMVIFLMGHMWAISGHTRIGLWLARWGLQRIAAKQERGVRIFSICSGVVLAAYPYTLVVTGHLGDEFDRAILLAEKSLPNEPYYITLFQISSIYGHAYTGDVVRTEVYSERLLAIHERSQLLRYRPLTRIMSLLPYALRGYPRLIAEKYESAVANHHSEVADPLINSQFYRVASLIALCLGDYSRAQDLIERASIYREKTKSFLIWKTFDEQISNYAKRAAPLDPEKDHLVIGRAYKKAPPQAGNLYREAFRMLVEFPQQTERELEVKMAALLADQVSLKDYKIISKLPDEIDDLSRLKLGSSYLEFGAISSDRRSYVTELLGHLSPLVVDIFQMFHQLKKSQLLEREAAVGKLAAQVAHDIRSPLSALEMMVHSIDEIPSDSRSIIKQAIGRIKDIANNLLAENRTKPSSLTPAAHLFVRRNPRGELLWPLIEALVSEKRSQYRDRTDISIESSAGPDDLCLFARCDPIDLSSILSNLVDNSVEASSKQNKIVVRLEGEPGPWMRIVVTDEGPGFPASILGRLGEKGVSQGKANGNGLALARLVECAGEWSGSVSFENMNRGAKVTLRLAREAAPKWLGDQIFLAPSTRIIAVDDDPSVHEIWNRRFLNPSLLVHCFNEDDLKAELAENYSMSSNIYLVDYELRHSESGLEVIRKYKLNQASQCFLVTSHFNSSEVQRAALELDIKIIPKFAAGFVPITSTEKVAISAH